MAVEHLNEHRMAACGAKGVSRIEVLDGPTDMPSAVVFGSAKFRTVFGKNLNTYWRK